MLLYLSGKDFDKVVTDLSEKELEKRDKYFKKFMEVMLNNKMSHKATREKKQKQQLEKWKNEEIHRRAQQMVQCIYTEKQEAEKQDQKDKEFASAMAKIKERVEAGVEIHVDGLMKMKNSQKKNENEVGSEAIQHTHYHYHGDSAPIARQTVINVANTSSVQVGNKNIANVSKDTKPEGPDPNDFDKDDLTAESKVFLKDGDEEIVGLPSEPEVLMKTGQSKDGDGEMVGLVSEHADKDLVAGRGAQEDEKAINNELIPVPELSRKQQPQHKLKQVASEAAQPQPTSPMDR